MSFVEKEEAATATNNNRKPVIKRRDIKIFISASKILLKRILKDIYKNHNTI